MVADAEDALGWRGPLLAGVLGALFAGGVLEVSARSRPLDRVQAVDLTAVASEVKDGVPTWRSSGSVAERMGTPCGSRPEVVLVGSSIFYGSGIEAEESLRSQLAARLPEACVRLVAEPGYTFDNQHLDLSRYLQTTRPAVVVWEVWLNMPNRWSVVGDTAYNFGVHTIEPGELPSPLGLPSSVNRVLFTQLAAYRHLVISQMSSEGPSWKVVWDRFVEERLATSVALLNRHETEVVLAYMPRLDRSFDQSTGDETGPYAVVRAHFGEALPMVDVAAVLASRGAEVDAARIDTCCHFSPGGTSLVADALADALRPIVAAKRASGAE